MDFTEEHKRVRYQILPELGGNKCQYRGTLCNLLDFVVLAGETRTGPKGWKLAYADERRGKFSAVITCWSGPARGVATC